MSCTDCKFKVGQIGAILVVELVQVDALGVETPFDVSAASTLQIVVGKPSTAASTPQTFTAVFAVAADGGTGDGVDGKIKMTTTLATDFDVSGDYEAEPYIVDATTGFDGRAQRVRFSVDPVLT